MSRDVVVGLGANLGDREATLRSAVRSLRGLLGPGRVSSLYETAPVGPPQPEYLNAAFRGTTELDLEALLDELLRIEVAHGRIRREKWGPRTLDLDVLHAAEDGAPVVLSSPRLVVPHPRLLERSFALAPLLDVAPELRSALGPTLTRLGAPIAIRGPDWAA